MNGQCTPFNSTLRFGKGGRNSRLLFEDLINIEEDVGAFYKPLEMFETHFDGISSNGDWTLGIHDEVLDGINGMLYNFSLDLRVNYCSDEVTWSKLAANSCDSSVYTVEGLVLQCPDEHRRHQSIETSRQLFTPRHLHSTIAVRDDVYIFGGFACGNIAETWRFNYLSNTFTRLNGVHSNTQNHGRMSILTPYGIIALGGIANEGMTNEHEPETLDENVYLYNVKTERTSKLGKDEM